MLAIEVVKHVIGEVLHIGAKTKTFDENTRLLGSLPEFDSMAVVSILTSVEERFDIHIDDDEVTAEIFETIGSFHEFLVSKQGVKLTSN